MALSLSTNNVISSLVQNSNDAMSNLFYIEFIDSYTSKDSHLANSLKLRTNSFTAPAMSQGTYEVNYMTSNMTYPSATVQGSKQLSFTMRVDRNYDLYKYLLSQQAKTSAANLAFATNSIPDPSADGLTIKVYGFDRPLTDAEMLDPDNTDGFSLMYTFRYCWISQIQLSAYNYSGSSPVTATVTVNFMDYDDPQNLLG